ncbi:MAG: hypothetical protein R2705_24035 [Ilumatobacteraceae bacterium]
MRSGTCSGYSTRSTGAELMGLPGPRASGYGPGDRAGLHYLYGSGVAPVGAQDALAG